MSLLQRHRLTILFAVLACLFLWRVVFAGQTFVPANILRRFAPWSESGAGPAPIWNPLGYDSIGQFYPWRKFAGESMREGRIPLWNPYQFCGTPFLANSQSAVLYPGNLLFYLIPTETAFGWTVILHLILAALFTALFLRKLGATESAQAIGGITFAFCTWQVSWLQLPTFLCSACWLPLALYFTHRLFDQHKPGNVAGLGVAIGLSLLGGHLQIGLYVVLSAGLLAVWLLVSQLRSGERKKAFANAAGFAGAIALGALLSAPQTIPALELSRRSHRVGAPSAEGYHAYVNYAVSLRGLATLVVPNFFGNPSNPDSPYAGMSRGGMLFNYAEGAMYVGLLPLVLAVYALIKRGRSVAFLAILALLALVMALGTAIDALLYFYFPGFGQSGSPGRVLVVWSFAVASLAALGFNDVLARFDSIRIQAAFAIVAVIGGALLLLAWEKNPSALGISWVPGLPMQAEILLVSWLSFSLLSGPKAKWLPIITVTVIAVDLFANGIAFNQTSEAKVLRDTVPVVELLKQKAGHDRVMPVNQNWSMTTIGPRDAALPPNMGMFLGLRDVQGYDSLFPGRYKEFMNRIAEKDASPPEVGNMVFARNPLSPLIKAMAVRQIVSGVPLSIPGTIGWSMSGLNVYDVTASPGRASVDSGKVEWLEDSGNRTTLSVQSPSGATLHLGDQMYPGWRARLDNAAQLPIESTADPFRTVHVPEGEHTVRFEYQPSSFRFGFYLAHLTLGLMVTLATRRRSARIERGVGQANV